jgi:hypothetical protein
MCETLTHSKQSLINYILRLSDMMLHNITTAAWSQYSLDVLSNAEGPVTTRSVEHWVGTNKTYSSN